MQSSSSSLLAFLQRASPCNFARTLRAFCEARPQEVAFLIEQGLEKVVDYYLDKMYKTNSFCTPTQNTSPLAKLEKILSSLQQEELHTLYQRRIAGDFTKDSLQCRQSRLSYFRALESKKKLTLFSAIADGGPQAHFSAALLLSIMKKRNVKKILTTNPTNSLRPLHGFVEFFSASYQSREDLRSIFLKNKDVKHLLDELYLPSDTSSDGTHNKHQDPQSLIDEMAKTFHGGLLQYEGKDSRFISHAGTTYFSLDYLYEKLFSLDKNGREEMLRLFEKDTVAQRMVYSVELSILHLLHKNPKSMPAEKSAIGQSL